LEHFGDRLAQGVKTKKTPALVGLDPRWESLPEGLKQGRDAESRTDRAAAFEQFCIETIDVVAPLVPAVKPQAAFFEQLGPAGMTALEKVVRHARRRGLIVVVDAKRGDIGSTAEAYADGFLGDFDVAPWGGDALTVNPYLGDDSLTPFVDAANNRGAGLFVLVKTSNPGGATFQDLVADGRPIYRHVAAHVERLAAETAGASGYGIVGGVVGATYPEQLAELRAAMPHGWLLVPGFGSQGGSAHDVAAAFDANGLGAIVNNSRGIIFAYRRAPFSERYGDAQWQSAVEAATREMIAQLADATSAGKL
jgi:orotidine-5'-phosphate decarboxylase